MSPIIVTKVKSAILASNYGTVRQNLRVSGNLPGRSVNKDCACQTTPTVMFERLFFSLCLGVKVRSSDPAGSQTIVRSRQCRYW